MKLKTLAAALVAVASLAVTAPAQADDANPPMRLTDPTLVCVLPQSPVMGSGWKLQRAVSLWNEAQDVANLRVYGDPACTTTVTWARYDSRTPDPNVPAQSQGWCGYTAWEGVTLQPPAEGSSAWTYGTAQVWMNDACLNATKATRKYFLAHELGHALGLPHVEGDASSVMCYCYDFDVLKGRPGASDVATLQALYNA